MSNYLERDAQRIVILQSEDGGATWQPDPSGGSNPALATSQQRYDISTDTIYIGTAQRGVETDSPSWTVRKIELTSNNPTSTQWATNIAWDDRTTEEYT